MSKVLRTIIILAFLITIVGCGGPKGATLEPTSPQAITPTHPPSPSHTPEPTRSSTSFDAATYRDETAALEFDYPANWTLESSTQIGERGTQALLLSPGTTPEALAAGGSRIAITTYMWDPKNDLTAYTAQRRMAWDDSDFTISSEAAWELSDGRPVKSFVVQGPDQERAFFSFTTVGEDYLQISGEGNLTLIEEIARTLRPLHSP